MAIHCSILAWKTPWTEDPCRLQFTGLQRVGHKRTHTYNKQNLDYVEIELVIKKKKKKLHLPTNNTLKPKGFTGVINHMFKGLTLIPLQCFQKQWKINNFRTHSKKALLS